ncbi:MAG: response regulator [Eubacterium sp.]|nr:response regulator [Eubacterium sp.]
MKDIIVVYPSRDTAMKLRALIEKGGYHVSHICAHGSTALEIAQEKRNGVIVCPFVMRDMSSADLADALPNDFDVIALSKNGREQYMGNMLTLAMPLNVSEFLQTVGILASSQSGFTKRSESENDYISKAKEALMSVKGMSEMQAHKYLQQVSMNSGKKLLQTAMDILDELN